MFHFDSAIPPPGVLALLIELDRGDSCFCVFKSTFFLYYGSENLCFDVIALEEIDYKAS
jgi:hypothetical protein